MPCKLDSTENLPSFEKFLTEGMEPRLYQFLVQKISVRIRNDQMLKVTLLKFKSWVTFGVGSKRISGGGSNLNKKVPPMERLLVYIIRL